MRTWSASIVFVALSSLAFAHQSAQDKAAMEQKQKEFIKAFKAKDPSWFDKNATSDFVAIDRKGKKYNRKQSMTQITELFSVIQVDVLESTVQGVKPVGKTLVVSTHSVLKGTLPGQNGKRSKLVDISNDEQTWVKSGSDWKIKVDKTVNEKATLDGKPIPGS